MNIYHINKKWNSQTERYAIPEKASGLKIAAGGEDIVSITDEALNSFKREHYARTRQQELVKLALEHVNDSSPMLDDIKNDAEFMKAEKLALLGELVVRVAFTGERDRVYERVTDFVADQLGNDVIN